MRQQLVDIIRRCKSPVIPELWERQPHAANDSEWKIGKAWSDFKHDFVNKKKGTSNIIDNFRCDLCVELYSE